MIIYKATNKITGKSYIGQTIRTLDERKREHLRYNHKMSTHFHQALYKYGWFNFTWETLCECDTREDLNGMEEHYIKTYTGKGLYNMVFNRSDEMPEPERGIKTSVMNMIGKVFKKRNDKI